MAYQWVDGSTTPVSQIAVAFDNGTASFDATITVDAGTQAQTATAMGAFKDALENAGFTVGAINTGKSTSQTLQDI